MKQQLKDEIHAFAKNINTININITWEFCDGSILKFTKLADDINPARVSMVTGIIELNAENYKSHGYNGIVILLLWGLRKPTAEDTLNQLLQRDAYVLKNISPFVISKKQALEFMIANFKLNSEHNKKRIETLIKK